MANTVRRGEELDPSFATHALATAEGECLGLDAVTLTTVEDKLLITKWMKKRRPIMGNCRHFVDLPEVKKRDT